MEVSEKSYSARGLGMVVFTAGAVMMCVEIVGGLTIAPYFGSNVFVWGSVISAFMGALALGYVLGGKVAARGTRPGVLSLLLAGAGALILLTPWIGPVLSRALLEVNLPPGLSPLRPLAAVVGLYFLPSMLLGMVSPIAVRIASSAVSSVGRSVGKLYALTTLGSVAGTLSSTFVLTVFFGNRAILFGCGAVLAAVSAVAFFLSRGGAPVERMPADTSTNGAPPAKPVAGLRLLVLVCGMVLMSLQVVGGAEIAPYFGSSVFVWGSVITVFLGAMTAGYRAGGWIADRRPTMMALATVVVAAGGATLLVPLIAPGACRAAQELSFGGGLNVFRPLVAALLVYFVPILLFAMVAPFAVRLSTAQVGQVGRIAGRLYALSTIGNVAGVLLTTFVLISLIGKTRLLELAGMAAVVAAIESVVAYNRAAGERRQPVLVSALLILAAGGFALAPKPALVPIADAEESVAGSMRGWTVIRMGEEYYALRRIRAERESPYHHIAVIEEKQLPFGQTQTDEGKTLEVTQTVVAAKRQLRFDQYIESAVLLDENAGRIAEPYTSGTTYADLLHIPLIFNPDVKDVLIIGGGGGVVPTLFKRLYPQVSIDVVEIDPAVVEVARDWFELVPDARLRVHVRDGRMFIHNSKQQYDLILLDAYTAGGRVPFHLTTQEFLGEVRDHLRPSGVVLMNVISAVSGPKSPLFRAELKTFRTVFPSDHVYVFPKFLQSRWDPNPSTNVMIVVTGRDFGRRWDRDEIVRRAEALCLARKIGIETVPEHAAKMLTDRELAAVPQDDVPVLTDDYAPVDMMTVNLH